MRNDELTVELVSPQESPETVAAAGELAEFMLAVYKRRQREKRKKISDEKISNQTDKSAA